MPSRPVEFHPSALAETQAAYDWYHERSPSAAAGLFGELDHAMEQIGEAPERWPSFLHGTRRFVLHRFPFSVVYRMTEAAIQIVALAHARRRPGYWKTR